MSYESPITQIMSDMQYKYEEDCVKVVQSYGFDVDKEELTKALLYDRNQYDKGYQQGRADTLTELWNIAISKYDEILSLEELAECIDEVKGE